MISANKDTVTFCYNILSLSYVNRSKCGFANEYYHVFNSRPIILFTNVGLKLTWAGNQQNVSPLKNTIAYNFFVNNQNQADFLAYWDQDLQYLLKKFCSILVINKKVISSCIVERWYALLVTQLEHVIYELHLLSMRI